MVRIEHGERETIVHQYLDEVRAWVAAPPEIDRVELERPRDPAHPPSRDGADRSSGARKREFPLQTEVQDVSLSIGTISIVIEEPKQTAPAVQPASPKADSSAARPASEPTRLSRYYLEPW